MELPEMNEAALRAVCKQHRLYQNPALNDKLYCNFKGFTSIACLEPYTGLRALFLEGNALDSLAGLPPLPHLRCLFLQQNALSQLTPSSLPALPALHTLNLGGNQLRSLAGLQGCTALHTLIAADNVLGPGAEALAPLSEGCPALASLDLQNNRLAEGPAVIQACACLPALKCLYLKGNPMVGTTASYRKAAIAAIPTLTYLDDRPVFPIERVCAEAWARGGLEAEREARTAFRERERERERRQVAALQELRQTGWRKLREARGMGAGGDPYLEGLPQELGTEEEEPAELVAARQRLAGLDTAGEQPDSQPPGLAEADMRAVLDERWANQAALQAEGGAPGPAKAENEWPNSSPTPHATAAACCEAPSEELAAEAVPEARLIVQVQASEAPTADQRQACAAAGGLRPSGAGQAGQAAGGNSDSEGSASVGEQEAEDDLDALD